MGCSCRKKHPEFTSTALLPSGRSISASEGRWVCPETKMSAVVGSNAGSIGGLASPARTALILFWEASAGE
jgi:hypothetical protein